MSFNINQGLLDLQFQADAWSQDIRQVEILRRGLEKPDSLLVNEYDQFKLQVTSMLNVWWLAYLGHERGVMDEDIWYGWNVAYKSNLCTPGGRKVLKDTPYFAPSFQAHLDQVLADCDLKSMSTS